MKGIKFIEKINFTIYNRWGEAVFSTTDPNETWTIVPHEWENMVYVLKFKVNGCATEYRMDGIFKILSEYRMCG